jgi:hypothetical protein
MNRMAAGKLEMLGALDGLKDAVAGLWKFIDLAMDNISDLRDDEGKLMSETMRLEISHSEFLHALNGLRDAVLHLLGENERLAEALRIAEAGGSAEAIAANPEIGGTMRV